jgi:hypothetical protein
MLIYVHLAASGALVAMKHRAVNQSTELKSSLYMSLTLLCLELAKRNKAWKGLNKV